MAIRNRTQEQMKQSQNDVTKKRVNSNRVWRYNVGYKTACALTVISFCTVTMYLLYQMPSIWLETPTPKTSADTNTADESYPCDNTSTALQMLKNTNLSGLNIIITGSNSGIGFETARAMAAAGGHVILACRSMSKADEAKNQILSEFPFANVTSMAMDLSSFKSVVTFANQFKEHGWPLHILVLNAGVMRGYLQTIDGLDINFQVNYLSQFLLTHLLHSSLLRTPSSRVVHVSSGSYGFVEKLNATSLTIEDLYLSENNHNWNYAYSLSKFCNLAFAKELHKEWRPAGVTSLAVGPGGNIPTNFFRYLPADEVLGNNSGEVKSVEQAAGGVVFASVIPELVNYGGEFLEDCCVFPTTPLSNDPLVTRAIWNVSLNYLHKTGYL